MVVREDVRDCNVELDFVGFEEEKTRLVRKVKSVGVNSPSTKISNAIELTNPP